MKRFIVAAVITVLPLLTACDSAGGDSLGSCATSLVGSFEGDLQGPIAAQLSFDGQFIAILAPDTLERDYQGDAIVNEEGAIAPTSQALRLEGSFDFDECTASGTWQLFEMDSGTWSVEPRKPASF